MSNSIETRSEHCEDYDHGYAAYRLWVKSLNPRQLAAYLAAVKPSIAGPEHYQALHCVTKPSVNGVPANRARHLAKVVEDYTREKQEKSGDNMSNWMGALIKLVYKDRTQRTTNMPRRTSKGGSPITYTTGMVKAATPGLEPLMELLHNLSPDSDESEVCGTTMAIYALGPRLFEQIVASGWLDVPLSTWHSVLKDPLVQIRRTMSFRFI